MASFEEQVAAIHAAQSAGERYLYAGITKWYRSVAAAWRPGTRSISAGLRGDLLDTLSDGYEYTATRALGYDWRAYKADDYDPFDEAATATAEAIDPEMKKKEREDASAIIATTIGFMVLATQIGIDQSSTQGRERDAISTRVLSSRGRAHSLSIAVTGSNWSTQSSRATAVLKVKDPLQNSVELLADLIGAGRINEARRLSRRILDMARMPLSVTQGELVQFISDNRDRLLTPVIQGRVVESMREMAQRLGQPEKEWYTLLDGKQRASHDAAHGQRRPADEPFTLAGGELMYPTDGSLGADLAEIVNCRCAAVWR